MVERDQVFAFVGGVGTATGRAVLDYIVDSEVVWVSPASGATHWAYPPRRYVFAQNTPTFDEAAVLADYVVEDLGVRDVAVVYQNDDFGKSGLIGARLALEEHGVSLLEALPVEVADTDLASHAVRLRASGAEAVLMWLTPRHATILLGASGRLGYEPQWMASSVLADTPLLDDLTEGAWQDVIFASVGQLADSGHPLLTAYQAGAARLAPDEPAGAFFMSGFRFAEPLVEALRRAGPDLTTDRLIEALESLDGFQGIGPPLTYGPDRRQGSRSVFLARALEGGRAEPLTGWIESTIDIDQAIRALEGPR
jgi:ABC-type branched-subunit amino acid transport system substrate-binding protein